MLQQNFGHGWEELVEMDITCVVFSHLNEQKKQQIVFIFTYADLHSKILICT